VAELGPLDVVQELVRLLELDVQQVLEQRHELEPELELELP
jgi:hypothetical protein